MSEELDPKLIKQLAEKGRKSLFFFARGILGFNKLTKHVHRPICKELENFKENVKIKVVLPRDWYKTTIASISYPIWRAINNPEIRVLLVQNTYSNAVAKLGAIKQIFEKNTLFQVCYPELLPTAKSTWTKDSLCVNRTGTFPESTFEAAGTSTSITSRHFDLVIEDDTVAPDYDNMTGALMQPTKEDIEKCIGFHRLVPPLLIEPAESQVLVVGTRWTEADLLAWIDEHEKGYKTITRACLENDKGEPDPNGNPTWEKTDDGTKKFTKEVIDQLFEAVGPYMASALYLNLPVNPENQLFRK